MPERGLADGAGYVPLGMTARFTVTAPMLDRTPEPHHYLLRRRAHAPYSKQGSGGTRLDLLSEHVRDRNLMSAMNDIDHPEVTANFLVITYAGFA